VLKIDHQIGDIAKRREVAKPILSGHQDVPAKTNPLVGVRRLAGPRLVFLCLLQRTSVCENYPFSIHPAVFSRHKVARRGQDNPPKGLLVTLLTKNVSRPAHGCRRRIQVSMIWVRGERLCLICLKSPGESGDQDLSNTCSTPALHCTRPSSEQARPTCVCEEPRQHRFRYRASHRQPRY